MTLDDRIKAFADDPVNIQEAFALMRVGDQMKASPAHIMGNVIANVLLRFHGIEVKPPHGPAGGAN